jgi:hypothetical protein
MPLSFGLWGWGSNSDASGFTLLSSASSPSVLKFQAIEANVVHPGTERDVAQVQWMGQQGHVPREVEVESAITADEINVDKGTFYCDVSSLKRADAKLRSSSMLASRGWPHCTFCKPI